MVWQRDKSVPAIVLSDVPSLSGINSGNDGMSSEDCCSGISLYNYPWLTTEVPGITKSLKIVHK